MPGHLCYQLGSKLLKQGWLSRAHSPAQGAGPYQNVYGTAHAVLLTLVMHDDGSVVQQVLQEAADQESKDLPGAREVFMFPAMFQESGVGERSFPQFTLLFSVPSVGLNQVLAAGNPRPVVLNFRMLQPFIIHFLMLC